jgi:hypothetical protein
MVSLYTAYDRSPFWVKGPVRHSWSFLRKFQIFRVLYETQSQLSSVVFLYLVLLIGDPWMAIWVNIIWSVLITTVYWWLLKRGQPDLMENPAEKGMTGFLVTVVFLWSVGWKQVGYSWTFGRLREKFRTGRWSLVVRKLAAYFGVGFFGVVPGHNLLKTEGHSSGWILGLNVLGRFPNAAVKYYEVVWSVGLGVLLWGWFRDLSGTEQVTVVLITTLVIRWLWLEHERRSYKRKVGNS